MKGDEAIGDPTQTLVDGWLPGKINPSHIEVVRVTLEKRCQQLLFQTRPQCFSVFFFLTLDYRKAV